jgi:hypothetical protein
MLMAMNISEVLTSFGKQWWAIEVNYIGIHGDRVKVVFKNCF